jgi:hypothetical protein
MEQEALLFLMMFEEILERNCIYTRIRYGILEGDVGRMLKAWLKYFLAFVGVPHRSHVSESKRKKEFTTTMITCRRDSIHRPLIPVSLQAT